MKPETQDLEVVFGGPVSIDKRAESVEGGTLVDVSGIAQKMGFRIPVALTASAWNDCVAWQETESNRQAMQDESSRLWDVLWRALLAARNAQGDCYLLQLYRVPREESAWQLQLTTLQVHIGRGDDGEPSMTILMPGEG